MTREVQIALADGASLPLHLVEEISHRVANEYAEAIAGLSLAASGPIDGPARLALRRAADRLHAHAENHRALLRPTQRQVNLADYIGDLCAAFARASLTDRHVGLTLETDEIWLASGRAWRLGLAIAELIRNAARHGLGGRPGAITVQIALSCGEVVCLVGDDGQTMADFKVGRGVEVIRALAEELDGSVEWRRAKDGCLVCLRAPAEPRQA